MPLPNLISSYIGHKVDDIDVIQNRDNLRYYIVKYCIFYSLILKRSIGENRFFKRLGPFILNGTP